MAESEKTTLEPIIVNGKRIGTRVKNPKMTYTEEELEGFRFPAMTKETSKLWLDTLKLLCTVKPLDITGLK
jgi:hypothetical protein